MDAGKIAGIVAGSVSVVVIGGLLVVKRKYLISLLSTSPTRTLTAEETADGFYYLPDGKPAQRLPDGRSLVLSPTKDPDDYDSDSDYDLGGKRRRTRRKKKGRK